MIKLPSGSPIHIDANLAMSYYRDPNLLLSNLISRRKLLCDSGTCYTLLSAISQQGSLPVATEFTKDSISFEVEYRGYQIHAVLTPQQSQLYL